jgi:hypothetical protein
MSIMWQNIWSASEFSDNGLAREFCLVPTLPKYTLFASSDLSNEWSYFFNLFFIHMFVSYAFFSNNF